MLSPIDATSRRIAWLRLTTCSEAKFSGSARRIAASAMERAVSRISCERRSTRPMAMKKTIGPNKAKAARAAAGPSVFPAKTAPWVK